MGDAPDSPVGQDGETGETSEKSTVWAGVLNRFDASARALASTCVPLAITDSVFTLAAPNDFTRHRVTNRLRTRAEQALRDETGRPLRLDVEVDPTLTPPDAPPTLLDMLAAVDPAPAPATGPGPAPGPAPVDPAGAAAETAERLNPKYTFDTFVIGSSNRFAHAAAVAIAESPGKSYNPLLIYGDSGLGKTHLLHAVGHYVRQYYPHLKQKYVSTEEMTNDFINALSDNKTAQFRRSYRDIDILLIDDIQFLESKISTQEEFFHTFNTLHNNDKQIVMTSDRPPKLLEALEPRLRSRFEWGLLADIQPADLETRIAILRKKAAAENLVVDSVVLEFIASRIQTNIRELEGALIRVTAFASLNRQKIDLALAQLVLRDLIPESPERALTPEAIMATTAAYFSLPPADLTGPNRSATVALARQIAMYLCRELTDLSLPRIGAAFGRDHTTVMHAYKKIKGLISQDRTIFSTVTEITTRVKQ